MDKYIELKNIFKGILTDLNFTDEQVKSIMDLAISPEEMATIVDAIDNNKNIKYDELFEIVLKTIKFDIVVDKKDLK